MQWSTLPGAPRAPAPLCSFLAPSFPHTCHPQKEVNGTNPQATRISTRGDWAPQGTFGDVWRYLCCHKWGWGGGREEERRREEHGEELLPGLVVEVRDAAQAPRMPRTVPTGEVSGHMTVVVAQSSPVPDLQARPSGCELGASCWMRVPVPLQS